MFKDYAQTEMSVPLNISIDELYRSFYCHKQLIRIMSNDHAPMTK